MRFARLLLAAAAIGLAAQGTAVAGGFQVFQQGAKASGRGGAFTAGADDASAVYYNPAAAARIDGWNLYLGASMVVTDTVFDPAFEGPVPMQPVSSYPSTIYLTGQMGESYSLGLGIWVPYALNTHWWATDPVASSALKASWTSKMYAGNVTVKLGPAWSMSMGIELVRLVLDDFSSIARFSQQWNIKVDGKKAGANVAFHYKGIQNRLRFGFVFRTRKIVRTDGVILVEDDSGGPALLEIPVAGNVVLPRTAQIGIGEEGRGRWDWEIDIQYARWSNFESLEFLAVNAPSFDVFQPEEWKDTFTLFGGFDYHFNDRHTGRGGIIADPTPIPQNRTRPYNPDADRVGLTAGYGWRGKSGRYAVDAYGQMFLYKEQRPDGDRILDIPSGTYDTRSYALGASFQYRF